MTASASQRVITLGCRLNLAEGERIAAILRDDDRTVVINSCAVTSEAVRQTRQAIRKARRAHPGSRIMVTGCAADIERDEFAAMPEVDGLVPNASKLDARVWNLPPQQAVVAQTKTRAFIPVQNGCDHACTFCVIPQGRGKSRSLTIDEVLKETEAHLALGAREVILTGVDVTSWGGDLPGSPKLGSLVSAILDHFPQLERLRMSSIDGVEMDDLLIDLFASEPRVMPHIHLSLQSGDDLILKRMKRRHSRRDAVELVRRLKEDRPEIAVGADLIAGFPTETEAMHANNLSIIEELDIVHGHIFPYSPRPNTPAARMPQVSRETIKSRALELRERVSEVKDKWLSGLLGRQHRILVEKDGAGYSPEFARVRAPLGIPAGTVMSVTPQKIDNGVLV